MNKRAGISILATILVMGAFSVATYNKTKITEATKDKNTETTEQTEQIKEQAQKPVEEKIPSNVAVSTIDGVSVRSINSANGKYLGSLQTGEKVKIEEKMNNGWYKIKYKNDYAYVSSSFMTVGEQTEKNTILNSGIVEGISSLPVRETSSTKSKKLGTLSKGDTVEIVDTTYNDFYKIKYKNTYAYVKGSKIKLKDEGEALNLSPLRNLNDFLFIGDSFTHRMENVIKANNNQPYIFAQSGSRPYYWLDKVGDMPDNTKVKAVSILIGVNGVTTDSNINDAKRLINNLIVKYPNKNIFVQKVFPVGENYTEREVALQNKSIDNFNKEIEEFCKDKQNVKFIDATSGLVDDKGYLKYSADGLHIDEEYNKDFYKNIFNAINSISSK